MSPDRMLSNVVENISEPSNGDSGASIGHGDWNVKIGERERGVLGEADTGEEYPESGDDVGVGVTDIRAITRGRGEIRRRSYATRTILLKAKPGRKRS